MKFEDKSNWKKETECAIKTDLLKRLDSSDVSTIPGVKIVPVWHGKSLVDKSYIYA